MSIEKFVLNETSYFGFGAREVLPEEIKNRGYKKVLVVTDKSLFEIGLTKKVTEKLDEAGIEYTVFSDVKPNPTVTNVKDGLRVCREFGADVIVAVGGGSSIDTAKGISIVMTNPDREDIVSLNGPSNTVNKGMPLIALPTTHGTAAEVTINYVITDEEREVKMVCVDPHDIPLVAIVDTELMSTLPKSIASSTGMDALTHAIEAYVSTLHCPYTDPLALQAIEMVLAYLPASYNKNMAAREQMHYAQCLAGMAFSNALLGIVHSMAHKTGAAFSTGHIPHGCANAIYLPYVIRYNAKNPAAAERYAEIARRMGLEGTCQQALINSLCEKIDEFNVRLNIPKTLKDFGIQEEEFKEKVAKIAELAVGDACTGSNPRAIDPANMEKLLTCTYYGTEVDF